MNALDTQMRANIDWFVATAGARFIATDIDIVEIGAGVLDTSERTLGPGNRYRRTERDTIDLMHCSEAAIADLIVTTEVLEHVPEPKEALATCFRLLRPGGHLLLSVPWEYPEHGTEDYWRYSRLGLDYLLDLAGFDVIVKDQGFVGDRMTNIFRLARRS